MKAPVVVFTYRKTNALKEIFEAVNAYRPECFYLVTDKSTKKHREETAAVKKLIDEFEFATIPELIEPSEHQGILHIFDHALDKIFQKEEQLIILEDDTVPSPVFFNYCNLMLEKYKDDSTAGCINGANLCTVNDINTFFTSRLSLPFWGWATWADRWKSKSKGWEFWDKYAAKPYAEKAGLAGINRMIAIFDYVRTKQESWDTQWAMHLLYANQRTILPGVNLITNKGYTGQATFCNIPGSNYANQEKAENIFASHFFTEEIQAEKAYTDEVVKCITEFRKRIIS